MKAIILAAGYATRLYPLTENFPKPLLEVGGKPILDWLLSDLSASVDEFIVVTNHKFSSSFSSWSADKKNVVIVDDGTESNETRLGAVKDIQLAVEGIEGTDALIRRSADLKRKGTGGVLVKVSKPQQDRRMDLPTIGPATVQAVKNAGFVGIAVEAGSVLISQSEQTVKLANQLGIFIVGVKA